MSEQLYLAHYGVKGQKWGVRNDPEKDYQDLEAGLRSGGGLVEIPSEKELQERMDDLLEAYQDGDIDREKYEDLKGRYEKLIQRFRKLKQNNQTIGNIAHSDYLAHYGIPHMKWYVRRYQNKDGTLTPEGRKRYGVGEPRGHVYKKSQLVGMEAKALAKDAGRGAKKMASDTRRDLKNARAQAKAASQVRKKERFERREARRQEIIEAKSMKLIERDSKKTIAELQADLRAQRIAKRQDKVDALIKQQEQIQAEALLKAQEAELKKSMKKLQKDADKEARKKLNKSKIRDLSDQELNERINRLKKEAELVSLEVDRNMSPTAKMIRDTLLEGAKLSVRSLASDAVTSIGKKALSLLDDKEKGAQLEQMTDALRKQLSYKKAQAELSDYDRDRKRAEQTNEQDYQAERFRKEFEERKRRDEAADYDRNRARAERERDQDLADEELRKSAQRAQNAKTIRDSLKVPDNAESESKRMAATITKRKELERRAENYWKQMTTDADGNEVRRFNYAEIAEQMGLSESEVKKLLYAK